MNNYTEQELEISNKSYTNKDFNTIYPELLDLVKKLTNKWDPTTSNESDPGVVLLKLWAILADKNNYNIDKNILETFPLSVTQRANAQKLYDMLGYDMHYYKSAITDITLWYIGNALNVVSDPDANLIQSLTVPKFTMITDDSGENIFTLLKEVTFTAKASPVLVEAIQGTIHDYEVNGVTDITLDNLDSEYRLFFTESRIAENGIFIANKGVSTLDYTEWKAVSNLESATLNSKIYKFGVLPNTQSCYIQFPQDIGTLIGNGLKIKYIISDGTNGNVQANQLTTFNDQIIPYELTDATLQDNDLYGEYFEAAINQDVTIKNTYSTTNGSDPETLDSAYKNYKKTIGTFNTLVTVADYEKAIYRLIDDLGLPFCSNVVVSDRTDDINYSTNIITLNGASTETQLYVDSDFESVTAYSDAQGYTQIKDPVYIKKPKMSAFDLGLYVLNPMLNIEDKTGYYYNKSFSVNSYYNQIVDQISNIETGNAYYKSAEHDFIQTLGNRLRTYPAVGSEDWGIAASSGAMPYIFKNFYTLTGKVITYYKVTEDEAEEIENNIKLALFKEYNARNVSFGEKIQYDDIVRVIENADTRIKTLILNEPEYNLKYMAGNDYIGSVDSAISLPIDTPDKIIQQTDQKFTQRLMYELLLKMIVSGHVQLYKFDKDILFDFGQVELLEYPKVAYVSSNLNISTSTSNIMGENAKGYAVEDNQNVILYAPNFYTKTSYGAYVNYYFSDSSLVIPKDTYYTLPQGQIIYLEYTDENGISKHAKIEGNTCIRFTDSGDSVDQLQMTKVTINKLIENTPYDMCTLSATQSIEIIAVNEVIFPSETNPNQTVLYCMWFTNKSRTITDKDNNKTIVYTLFDQGQSEKLLQDNEYFIYTNTQKNELVILGSGTLLVRPTNENYSPAIEYQSKVPIESIVENGQAAITEADWYRYSLVTSADGYARGLAIVELQIVTLGSGAGVRFEGTIDLSQPKSELSMLQNDLAKLIVQKESLPNSITLLESDITEINTDIARYTTLKQLNITNSTKLTDYVNVAKSEAETATKIEAMYAFSDEIADIIATQNNEYILDLHRKYSLHKDAFSIISEDQLASVVAIAEDILTTFNDYVVIYNKQLDEKITPLTNRLAQSSITLTNLKNAYASIDTDISQKQADIAAKNEQISALQTTSISSISNTPLQIINPEYCEVFDSSKPDDNTWVKLDDYQITTSTSQNGINYYKGWSIVSRFNLMTGYAKEQTLPDNASIDLYAADTESGARNPYPINTTFNEISGEVEELGTIRGGKSILSNTVLAFGGGQELQVSTSNNKDIVVYSYTEAELPTYFEKTPQGTALQKHFERGSDGFITIHWADWIRKSDKSYDQHDTTRDSRLFPISFATSNFGAKVAVTLLSTVTKAIIKVKVGDNPDEYPEYELNSGESIAYVELPVGSQGLIISSFESISNDAMQSADIDIASDTLRIGYPQVQRLGTDQNEFSDQVITTLDNIIKSNLEFSGLDNATEVARDILVPDINDRYPEFDVTYNIFPEDSIDGEATSSNNYNNLFAGDLVWDKNHICNKYTIPQFDFKNSSIKVAQVYIKK